MSARDAIAFLVGSDSRVAIIRALRDEPRRPSELADDCSCARETAQRAVSAFVDRGWAEKQTTEGDYALTAAGRMVVDGYDEFETSVAVADRLSALLSNIGEEAAELDPRLLRRLRETTATEDDPHAPLNRFLTVIGDQHVETFRGITPIVSGIFNRAAARVIGPESSVELVIDESVFETSTTEYPDDLARAYELDQFRLFVSPTRLEFGLLIVDGHGYVGAYDDHGNVVASIDGTEDRFVEWCEKTYRHYREQSSVPPATGFDGGESTEET